MNRWSSMIEQFNKQGVRALLPNKQWGISIVTLKILALITMFFDHFAMLFCQNDETIYTIFRSVGRISFPLFAFVLTEGFFYTKNRADYVTRLGIFALISEVPYDMMYGSFFRMESQNILFTLLIGFLLIWGLETVFSFRIKYPHALCKHFEISVLNVTTGLLIIIISHAAAYCLHTPYSYAGVMLIMCFYVFRQHHFGRAFSNLLFNFGMFGFTIQWWGAVSILPIALYNDKAGKRKWKYFFYWFYPVHITILVFIKYLLDYFG